MDFPTFWGLLEAILIAHPSSPTVFNQYRDAEGDLDVPDAASVRRANLRNYLAQATASARALVVGEAAGPWGCRFSGVPFTGEQQLLGLLGSSFPFRGEQSSKQPPARPVRLASPYMSASSEAFWEAMLPYQDQFVAWDAFPLHPHKRDDALTVRNPTKGEVRQFAEAMRLLVEYVKPELTVAVGRKAEEGLATLGVSAHYVRHPSRGGQAAFTAGMRSLFGA